MWRELIITFQLIQGPASTSSTTVTVASPDVKYPLYWFLCLLPGNLLWSSKLKDSKDVLQVETLPTCLESYLLQVRTATVFRS
jgi:hypothetical protein